MSDTVQLLQLQKKKKKYIKHPHETFPCELHSHVRKEDWNAKSWGGFSLAALWIRYLGNNVELRFWFSREANGFILCVEVV